MVRFLDMWIVLRGDGVMYYLFDINCYDYVFYVVVN